MPDRNPFSAFFAGQAGPPRIARPGSISAFAGVPTAEQFAAAERQHARGQAAAAEQRKMEAVRTAVTEVARLRTRSPNAAPPQIMAELLNSPQFVQAMTSVPSAEDIHSLVNVIAQASQVPIDRLPELLAGFEPGRPVPKQGAGRFAAPELGGQSRTGGELTQALDLSPEQARQMQAASRLDPAGTIAPTHKTLVERALGTGEAGAPIIPGLLPEQQEVVNASWAEGKPAKTMDQAMKMRAENQQAMTGLETVIRMGQTLTGMPADPATGTPAFPGDITQALALAESAAGSLFSPMAKNIPGTETRKLAGYLDSIKSNIGFDQLLAIKRSGAGLGQVPQTQLESLQSVLGELTVESHPAVLKENLRRVEAIYGSIIRAANADLQRYRAAAAGQPVQGGIRPGAAPSVDFIFNEQTGQVEPAR